MMIDISVLHSLEIVNNRPTTKCKDSLFGLLNRTKTPMGCRILRNNILQPPTKYDTFIGPRHDAVEEIIGAEEVFHAIRKGTIAQPCILRSI
jgi:DNA mismatch repair protein MSH4